MSEMRKYRKWLHQKEISRWKNHFEQQDKKIACKNTFVRGVWFLVKYPLKFSIIYIFLYWDYYRSLFQNFTFDAYFMDYHIQTTGKTVNEALIFLNEQDISLKEYVYRGVITKRKRKKAENSLDYLFTKYKRLKENTTDNSEKTQSKWIETLWDKLFEKKCVKDSGKSDFVLIMFNYQPLKKVIWYKGLKWLVQFVREGIAIGKIKIQGNVSEDRFITNYIMRNFCPYPALANQKAECYTEERIKAAANENLKEKIKGRMYFVFEYK
jgi:hypothetical protein